MIHSNFSPLINIIYWPWPLSVLGRDSKRNLKASISQPLAEVTAKEERYMIMWQRNRFGECQRQKGITISSDSPQKAISLCKTDSSRSCYCELMQCECNIGVLALALSLPHALSLIPLLCLSFLLDPWLISNRWAQWDSERPCGFTALLRSPRF